MGGAALDFQPPVSKTMKTTETSETSEKTPMTDTMFVGLWVGVVVLAAICLMAWDRAVHRAAVQTPRAPAAVPARKSICRPTGIFLAAILNAVHAAESVVRGGRY